MTTFVEVTLACPTGFLFMKSMCMIFYQPYTELHNRIKNGQILILNLKFPRQILTLFAWKWFSIENIGLAEYFVFMPWFGRVTFEKLYFLKMDPIFVVSCATKNKSNRKIICWQQLLRHRWAFSRLSTTVLHKCGHTNRGTVFVFMFS